MAERSISADGQDAVFKVLGAPSTHGGAAVRRYDTHAAVVFAAGDRAVKVKRAVRYPFLDYSTLDKREAACRAELKVNRKFAPQLYRRVVPITREPDGTLKLDGAGAPVEWAVEMTRFDEDRTLDRLAERGELDEALAGKLALAVAAMHERAEPVDAAPWLAALAGFIADNSAAFRQHGALFAGRAIAALDDKSRAALPRLQPLLVARGAAGLVRRGHGDLHLGNIAVLDGEPVAFDALEFDPIIAEGDVLYDLGFLLMDLVERELPGAANTVLNGYFAASHRVADCDGIAALPFFMSLRAAIRANVTAARLDLPGAPGAGNRQQLQQSAKKYFALALALLAPAKPKVICTAGLSGTGKSLLARALAPALSPPPGALIFRSDAERKALYGVTAQQRLPADAYRLDVNEKVYRILTDKAERVARAGHCVILDAVFARPQERAAIEQAAAAAGADFHGLFLVAPLPTRLERVGRREADVSDADAAVTRAQEQFDLGTVTWTKIDASGSPDDTLAQARAAIFG